MKRIVLFFVASLLLISESATVYTSEKQEVQATPRSLCYKLAIQRVFSVLPRNYSYIPIYLRSMQIEYSVNNSGTAAAIQMYVWNEGTKESFTHTIPAGTSVDASYEVPYPSSWMAGGSLRSEIRGVWMVVEPLQNGLVIDISELSTQLDKSI